jgi:hypothetical protein
MTTPGTCPYNGQPVFDWQEVDEAIGCVLDLMEGYAEEHGRELFVQALDELPDADALARDEIDRALIGYHRVACLLMRVAEQTREPSGRR